MLQVYSRARLLIHPPLSEAFGMTIVEAASQVRGGANSNRVACSILALPQMRPAGHSHSPAPPISAVPSHMHARLKYEGAGMHTSTLLPAVPLQGCPSVVHEGTGEKAVGATDLLSAARFEVGFLKSSWSLVMRFVHAGAPL